MKVNLAGKTAVAGLFTAAGLIAAGCGPSLDPYQPKIIPTSQYADAVPLFTGPGTASNLTQIVADDHPGLSARGTNSMHGDASMSGTHPDAGPTGLTGVFKVGSANMLNLNGIKGGQCGNTNFTSTGLLISFCADFQNFKIYALQAVVDQNGDNRFRKVAEYAVPERETTTKAKQDILNYDIELVMSDTSGGAYFHLDDQDRVIIADAKNHLQILQLSTSVNSEGYLQGVFTPVYNESLGLHVDNDVDYLDPNHHDITDVIPDWNVAGLYWFVTRQGIVGTADTTVSPVDVQTIDLGEEIQNAMAMDASGTYVVSDTAMYKFSVGAGNAPQLGWGPVAIERGFAAKPGQINQGSGTTPTLMGSNNEYVAITDNDDPVNVVVMQRSDGTVVCEEPVFNSPVHVLNPPHPDGWTYASASDNSLIGYNDSLIVENNWGYENATVNNWSAPGLTRVDVVANVPGDLAGNCDTVWANTTEASQSTVPKLSIGSGLVYIYTREDIPGNGQDPDGQGAQAYYFGALDYADGEVVYKVLTGTGENYNNNYSPITILDGTAYVGVFNGIISVQDN